MTLRQQILSIVKEAFNAGEKKGSKSKKENPVPKSYRSIHNVEDTMVGDVLIDLEDPSLHGYVIFDEKKWKTILWNNGKLITYKKDSSDDFCVRQLRNVSLDHLFRWLTQ